MASVDEMPCEHEIGVHALSISDTSAKTSADGALVQNHCKACTICSMGAVAPPPGPPHQNGSLESDTPTISPAGTFFSFIPPGIERPPKPLLYCPNGLRWHPSIPPQLREVDHESVKLSVPNFHWRITNSGPQCSPHRPRSLAAVKHIDAPKLLENRNG